MDLLLIGDGGRYIDLSKAHKVDLGGATYWESAGVWIRQQAGSSRGQLQPEREAFLAFMRQGRFTEAGKYFPELFKDSSLDGARLVNFLPVEDGSRYIDLSKADKVDLDGATYYKSAGAWVRQQAGSSRGQLLPEREAFQAFMRQGRFTEARKHFPELFKDGSKVQAVRQPDKHSYAKAKTISRFTAVGILGLLFAAYIAAVVTGNISPGHQLSTADVIAAIFVAVAIGLLLRAEFLRDIQEFGFGGLNVKMRNKVQDLEETQKDQSKELEELRFTLLLLVTDNERKHLETSLRATLPNINVMIRCKRSCAASGRSA
jgi:hypothetical protein